jgi:hypothetical protein
VELLTVGSAALIGVFVLFLIILSRLSGDGPGIAELFKSTTDLGWPRGIQEEEPVRWRLELLDASRPMAESADLVGTHDTVPAAGRDGSGHAHRRVSSPVT